MRKRSRKQPIVSTSRAPRTATVSRKTTQSTIATYHTLLKRQAFLQRQLAAATDSAREGLESQLSKINSELQDLGGIDGYQHASTLGQSSQRGGDTSKVLIMWLEELRKGVDAPPSIKMLEIGALTPDNYGSCSNWIENHPIDLNSRYPGIVEQDFLQRPLPSDDSAQFDIISCSLVVNFVPEPKDRGRMLQLCRSHLRPRPSSLLFIVLPFPCVNNSRYLTADSFKGLVCALGFELVCERWHPSSKVAYWLWRWKERNGKEDLGPWKTKTLLNEGQKRNNFTILI